MCTAGLAWPRWRCLGARPTAHACVPSDCFLFAVHSHRTWVRCCLKSQCVCGRTSLSCHAHLMSFTKAGPGAGTMRKSTISLTSEVVLPHALLVFSILSFICHCYRLILLFHIIYCYNSCLYLHAWRAACAYTYAYACAVMCHDVTPLYKAGQCGVMALLSLPVYLLLAANLVTSVPVLRHSNRR